MMQPSLFGDGNSNPACYFFFADFFAADFFLLADSLPERAFELNALDQFSE